MFSHQNAIGGRIYRFTDFSEFQSLVLTVNYFPYREGAQTVNSDFVASLDMRRLIR